MADIGAITYEDLQPITPSDTGTHIYAGFMADVAGVIVFTTFAGTKVTKTILAGLVYSFPIRRVWATSTTATGIHGLVHPRYAQ